MSASRLLWVLPALLLACSGDSGPGPDGRTGPQPERTAAADQKPGADQPGACPEGEKRCDGMFAVAQCKGGSWVKVVDCQKLTDSSGGHNCTCSATHLFVCTYGGKDCS